MQFLPPPQHLIQWIQLRTYYAMSGKPFQAFPGQDHKAHIDAHLNFMAINIVQNNPGMMAALQKNILEHISLMAQEQVQLEFVEELQEMQMFNNNATDAKSADAQNPQAMQQQRVQQFNQIEARKAMLIAEMTEDYAKEEEKISVKYGGDPLLKLKARELDLKARENQEEKNNEARINLDKMKAMMNQQHQDEKLEQNEDLAELRAETVIAKQEMSDQSKITRFW